MSWAGEIAKLRREVTTQIDNTVARLFGWTLTSSSSSMGDKDSVQTGDEPDSEGKQGQRPVRRIEPWGLRTRPPAKVRSLWLRLGSSNVVFLGIAPTTAYGPDSIEEGETAMYCSAGGTEVRLDKDGNVKITSASGKLVTVNGDDYSLPKWDDYMTGLSSFLSALKTDMTAANAGSLVGNPAIIAFEGAIAGAQQYKSTKAKNG